MRGLNAIDWFRQLPPSNMVMLQFQAPPRSGPPIRVAIKAAVNVVLAGALLVSVPSRSTTQLDLSAFRGQVVYLDFWASWCAPCRQSFPWMQELKTEYAPRGLVIIAINVDRDRADAERFLFKFRPQFEVRFDPQGVWAEQYNVVGMPTSVVIDRKGVVRFTHVGFRPADAAMYAQQIQTLLSEQ